MYETTAKLFVNFENAKALEPIFQPEIYFAWRFGDESGLNHYECRNGNRMGYMQVGIPLISQVIEWFKETHNIYIQSVLLYPKEDGSLLWAYKINRPLPAESNEVGFAKESFACEPEALNEGIKEAIALINETSTK